MGAQAAKKVVIPLSIFQRRLIDDFVDKCLFGGDEADGSHLEFSDESDFEFIYNSELPEYLYFLWKIHVRLAESDLRFWNMDEFKAEGLQLVPPDYPFREEATSEEDDIRCPEDLSDEDSEEDICQRDDDIDISNEEEVAKPAPITYPKGPLSSSQLLQFHKTLRELTQQRSSIAEAMVFCISNSASSAQIASAIVQSLQIDTAKVSESKLWARLYLIHDLLFNSSADVPMAWKYLDLFRNNLKFVMISLHLYSNQLGRLKAEEMRTKIKAILDCWKDWQYFSHDIISGYQACFEHGVHILTNSKLIDYASENDSSCSSPSDTESDPESPIIEKFSGNFKSENFVSIVEEPSSINPPMKPLIKFSMLNNFSKSKTSSFNKVVQPLPKLKGPEDAMSDSAKAALSNSEAILKKAERTLFKSEKMAKPKKLPVTTRPIADKIVPEKVPKLVPSMLSSVFNAEEEEDYMDEIDGIPIDESYFAPGNNSSEIIEKDIRELLKSLLDSG